MRRRALLAAVGVGLGGVTAVSVYEPTTLRVLNVANPITRSQTIDVRVIADGKTALHETLELDANEHRQIDCAWPNPARTYRYGARLDGDDEWTETTITDGGDACRRILAWGDHIQLRRWSCSSSAYEMFETTPCEVPWWVHEVRGDLPEDTNGG